MVERIQAPPTWTVISRQELAKLKLDAAAQEAVTQGQEKVKIVCAKANDTVKDVTELMKKAGLPDPTSSSEEALSAEGSEKENEKKD